jgi:hypothetical protein
MALRRALPAGLAVAAALALAACGEKEETITSSDTTETSTPTTATIPDNSTLERRAEKAARVAASAAVPKGFAVRPTDWTVSQCQGATGGYICGLRSGPCGGSVMVFLPREGGPSQVETQVSKKFGCVAD